MEWNEELKGLLGIGGFWWMNLGRHCLCGPDSFSVFPDPTYHHRTCLPFFSSTLSCWQHELANQAWRTGVRAFNLNIRDPLTKRRAMQTHSNFPTARSRKRCLHSWRSCARDPSRDQRDFFFLLFFFFALSIRHFNTQMYANRCNQHEEIQ